MKRLLLLLCCLLSLPVRADEPQVRVESRLQPSATAMVGGTVRLEVDVLVDSWFTRAPQLPDLQLSGALVMPPSGAAEHLTETRDGTTFFGLRYAYRITPNRTGDFDIPALSIRLMPAQASGEMQVHTAALSFSARQPPGFAAGQPVLVAQALRFSQQLEKPTESLKVGDNLTRELRLEADGAEAMLLPPPRLLEDIAGLRRYAEAPLIQALDDGRGNIKGGQRIDRVSYRIDKPGHYRLPAIDLQWWDITTSQARSASVPALEFDAQTNNAYQVPFSVTEDLERLSQSTRLHLSRHGLDLAALLLVAWLLWHFGRLQAPRARAAWQRWQAARQAAWLASPEHAWQQVRDQLNGQPPQLGALYLWVRRIQGDSGLLALARRLDPGLAQRLLGSLGARFGYSSGTSKNLHDFEQPLQSLHKHVKRLRPQSFPCHGLRPLNPHQAIQTKDHS
ncbi:BatD family protein [Azomonas macrocytogenes]|uniref:Protein BatD n=1 Tax=Azomonas macrocytogenes TaxID=69962 RepID=A0A839T8A6_AZOMA|nr:BatD family protein [Azomonas macrocytogenes]MBB3105100.1 hypothetical protein [Azomonas macrocytogenes]